MSARDDYFARVVPLLGRGLADRTIAVHDVALTGRVVELLASCMLESVVAGEPGEALAGLKSFLEWKNGFLPMRWSSEGDADATVRGLPLEAGQPARVHWDAAGRSVTLGVPAGDRWAHANLTYAVARRLCEILRGVRDWPDGVVYHGCRLWPFAESARPPREVLPPGPDGSPRAHVLVAGAGSVGSEAVRQLAPRVGRFTLVDDARVTVFNPHRQWFGSGEIGRPKVDALAGRLGVHRVRAVAARFDHATRARFEELLDSAPPDAALLATGTMDDATLAQVLTERGIPHVVAYAYPQARFFEVTAVDRGTPCLHCFRGNLFRGIESPPPMSDETARFLYGQADDRARGQLYRNLVAEPASAIETGRIADVAALCLTELLLPCGARRAWFRRVLAAGTNCLLGGNVVEDRDGEPAYGLTFAGQVVRLGVGDIAGAGDHVACRVCRRVLPVAHDTSLEDADPAGADEVLLS